MQPTARCCSAPLTRVVPPCLCPCGAAVPQVQYPDALPTMALDLSNIRLAAAFLAKTEIRFDLVSAVDELAAQVGTISSNLIKIYELIFLFMYLLIKIA